MYWHKRSTAGCAAFNVRDLSIASVKVRARRLLINIDRSCSHGRGKSARHRKLFRSLLVRPAAAHYFQLKYSTHQAFYGPCPTRVRRRGLYERQR